MMKRTECERGIEKRPPGVRGGLWVAVILMTIGGIATRHEIPADITVQAFIKPEGQRLRILIRVPLQAMRDMEFPLHGPGYLDFASAEPELRNAATIWLANQIEVFEASKRLSAPTVGAVRASIPSDRAFTSYEEALEQTTGPRLPSSTMLYWENAMFDVLLEYPIASAQSEFAIRPNVSGLGLRVSTVLRFLPPDGTIRPFQYVGDAGLVRLDPSLWQATGRFVAMGFEHILDGIDHLLFLLCLVIPIRRVRTLVGVVTAFTVAHSITLVAASLGFAPSALWFPALVETLIAASIVYMALENIVGTRVERRWGVAFAFGLVHGFGFSFALQDTMQFAGMHLVTSLLSFNIGVELGQVMVVVIMVPILAVLFQRVVGERIGAVILSALVAHTGWHWMTDRGRGLLEYPAFADGVSRVLPWAIFAIALGCWALLTNQRWRAAWKTRLVEWRSGFKDNAIAKDNAISP